MPPPWVPLLNILQSIGCKVDLAPGVLQHLQPGPVGISQSRCVDGPLPSQNYRERFISRVLYTIFITTYLCSKSNCSKNDRTIGCVSPTLSMNGVRFLVPLLPPSPSPPFSTSLCSVNTMSSSIKISLSSGGLDWPKHNPDTTSIKKLVQHFLMADNFFFSSAVLK